MSQPFSELLRAPDAPVDLAAIDTRATPGFTGSKRKGRKALAAVQDELTDLQERLFAHGRSGGRRRVLLILQGMDTSGKGGAIKKVVGPVNPQGVSIVSFGAPTSEELRHHFLWRIKAALPGPGIIGVFDRSHYEDVLVARVRSLVRAETVTARYDQINAFEAELVESGCVVIKVLLHISAEEQRERLLARLDDPTKHWKYQPGDVDDRLLWSDYQRAYETMLERCHTATAPWHLVPADRKWYRNLAVTQLVLEQLRALDLDWPVAQFDIEEERRRVAAS